MSLKTQLQKLWPKSRNKDEDPPSIVLLLREPHFFTQSELESAGESAWDRPFDGKSDPMYFVVNEAVFTIVKAGRFVMHVSHNSRPYLEVTERVAKQLPQPEQRSAWLAHRAWVSLDLWNHFSKESTLSKAESYAALARLALQLGDANCSGIYLPGENMMMPNDGTAEEGLRLLIRRELPLNS